MHGQEWEAGGTEAGVLHPGDGASYGGGHGEHLGGAVLHGEEDDGHHPPLGQADEDGGKVGQREAWREGEVGSKDQI